MACRALSYAIGRP